MHIFVERYDAVVEQVLGQLFIAKTTTDCCGTHSDSKGV